jgi:hypothetical protein
LSSSIAAFAQTGKKNAIKTNPTSLLYSTLHLEFQHQFDPLYSLQLGTYYTYSTFNDTRLNGIGFMPEIRLCFSTETYLQGWYLAYNFKQEYHWLNSLYELNLTNQYGTSYIKSDASAKVAGTGGGISVGRQWVWSAFTIDLFAGIGYINYSRSINNGDDTSFDFSKYKGGIGVGKTGVSVGYAF